jgi:hypothetical protein
MIIITTYDLKTECRDRVVNTPASYSNFGPETSYPDRVFVVFLVSSRQMLR